MLYGEYLKCVLGDIRKKKCDLAHMCCANSIICLLWDNIFWGKKPETLTNSNELLASRELNYYNGSDSQSSNRGHSLYLMRKFFLMESCLTPTPYLAQHSPLLQTWKRKRFRFFPEKFPFFPVCFRCFSGLIPEKGRKNTGLRPKKAESFRFQCQVF